MTRILHIEDDPANRLLVRKLLQAAGFEVVDAADGLEGVRLAIEARPDLVLVDLNIPHLDGYEVALRLRAEPALARVPIVAITAEGSREGSLAVGCDGFVHKPLDAKTFASRVRHYLGGQRENLSGGHETTELRSQSQRIVSHLEEKVRELSEANARLREVDAARTAFYRNISHELATPMTPIVGYVRLLADEELGPLAPTQRKAVRALDECVKRLRGLLDNLLDVTGLETGRLRLTHTPYDFLDTVRRGLAKVADRSAEAGITLLDDLPRGPLPATGDGAHLGRAIHQLLDNALKFTPSGGTVGVRVKATPKRYEVIVADSGSGIPPALVARVFDAFFQADGSKTRAHGGVGVGLAIGRKVARAHGGDVVVESPCDVTIEGARLRGAAFALTVAVHPPEQRLEPRPPGSSPGSDSTPRG